MKKNINTIQIRLSSNQYYFMRNLIDKYKIKYDSLIAKLKGCERGSLNDFNVEKEISLINAERQLITKILNDIANEFSIFMKYKVAILLTGSYARGTNRFTSDLDLHLFYKNRYKKKIFIYEEMYYYIIAIILDMERNNIHPVITTYFSGSKRKKFSYKKETDNLKIILSYQSIKIEYNFYGNTKKRYFLQYQNSKSLKMLEKYLKKEVLSFNHEWVLNYININKSKDLISLYNKLLIFEKKKISKKQIVNNINHLFNKINNLEKLKLNNNEIGLIKDKFHRKGLYNIYNFLAIIRLILIYKGIDIKKFNIKAFYYNKDFGNIVNNKLFKEIYKYNWELKKLSYYCIDNNVRYSLHSKQLIDKDLNNLDIMLNNINQEIFRILVVEMGNLDE